MTCAQTHPRWRALCCIALLAGCDAANGDDDADGDSDADVDADADADADTDADGDADGDADQERCNGRDDDGDGEVDEGDPQGGEVCNSGRRGICAPGAMHCVEGALECVSNLLPGIETCANPGSDDDCNGERDDFLEVGAPCDTGAPGACAAGTGECDGLEFTCIQNDEPREEQCLNEMDDDCDGQIDEVECDDHITCDEMWDPVAEATVACFAIFPFCTDTIWWVRGGSHMGIIGTIEGDVDVGCHPPESWQMFCYATGYDDFTCTKCVIGQIQRQQDCGDGCGQLPVVGQWCPQE